MKFSNLSFSLSIIILIVAFSPAQSQCPLLFAPAVNYGVGNGPAWAVSADYDNDGDFDLALTICEDDSVSILLNDGNGTFAARVNYETGNLTWLCHFF